MERPELPTLMHEARAASFHPPPRAVADPGALSLKHGLQVYAMKFAFTVLNHSSSAEFLKARRSDVGFPCE